MKAIFDKNMAEVRNWIDLVLSQIPTWMKVGYALSFVAFWLWVLFSVLDKPQKPIEVFWSFIIYIVLAGVAGLVVGVIYSDIQQQPTSQSVEPDHPTPSIHKRINSDDYPPGQYVYLIQDVDVTRYCKIGRTTNLSGRLQRFGIELPFNHNLIHLIYTGNSSKAETALHRRFKAQRMNGEWFALSDDDIEFIKSISAMGPIVIHAEGNGHYN